MARRIKLAGVAIVVLVLGGVGSLIPVAAEAGRVPFDGSSGGVDRSAVLAGDGTISIGGVLDCPAGSPARIRVTLTQPSTGATGHGEWSGTCTGEGPSRAHRSQRWQTIVSPTSSVAFVPGTGTGTGTGSEGLRFDGVATWNDVTDTWSQEPINLTTA
ncbi:MAG: hypothetical protein ACRDT4_06280 [Micromonosporaceae bacterium]